MKSKPLDRRDACFYNVDTHLSVQWINHGIGHSQMG